MDIRRTIASRPPVTDVLSWIDMYVNDRWTGFWGTLGFKLRAKLTGVEYQNPIWVWGPVHCMRVPQSTIRFGKGVRLVSLSRRSYFTSIKAPMWLRTCGHDSVIDIGDRVGLSGTAILCRSTSVVIEEGAMIAPNVTITDSDTHSMWPPEKRQGNPGIERDRPVRIGRNVWLGAGSMVLKGVTIGENSIIGAGSVVTKDIPPNVIAAGVPARVIRALGPEDAE